MLKVQCEAHIRNGSMVRGSFEEKCEKESLKLQTVVSVVPGGLNGGWCA